MPARTIVSATGLLIAAALTLALPDATAAQAPVGGGSTSITADVLHARAASLFETPDRYATAAQLLVRAAGEREAGDAVATKELITAAKLYSYAGRARIARSTMTQAAERALADGDVRLSAHAYVDAAILSAALQDAPGASDLLLRARRLAMATHLSANDRDAILGRLAPSTAVASYSKTR